MAEDEVKMEVEAVESVYGDDCAIIESYPPHLNLHIKPRTADISSQQFVEAVIGIRASPQYPKEPPVIYLIDSKGLDEQRKTLILSSIRDKASELTSCFMLVALCEEAVEKLSAMNHPDGDCPLCLYPLVSEEDQTDRLPFMKLMSCFHCFHSECIIRWWNWLQIENKNNANDVSSSTLHLRNRVGQQDKNGAVEESIGNCPVCRKVFHTKDFEHVLDLVGSHSSRLGVDKTDVKNDEVLVNSDLENLRRQKFEEILKVQQENFGLIGLKAEHVVLPSINPQNTVTLSNHASAKETSEQSQSGAAAAATAETNSSSSSTRPANTRHWNSGTRRQRPQNSRKNVRQWVRKDTSGAAE